MANNRRRAERRKEIEQLVHDGRLAHRLGKTRTSVPWRSYESMNAMHWRSQYLRPQKFAQTSHFEG